MQLILASQSPQRAALLQSIEVPFLAVPSHFDELNFSQIDPFTRAEQLAIKKTEVVAAQFPEAVILGADTYVKCGEKILEKPLSKGDAEQMLQLQSNREVVVVCGVACFDQTIKKMRSATVLTTVIFRDLSDQEIAHYVANNLVTTWSGGYSASYPAGQALLKEVRGSLSALNGLPMEVVIPWLRELGLLI